MNSAESTPFKLAEGIALEGLNSEEIANLPILRFQGESSFFNANQVPSKVLDSLKKSKVLGFDTESQPSFKKGEQHPPALIQLSNGHQTYLLCLLNGSIQPELLQIFANPDIIKVGVAIRDDIRTIKEFQSNFEAKGFIDLSKIAHAYGIKKQGLRNLAALLLNGRISKSAQTSNWSQRPLTENQKVYAATDAWASLKIFEYFIKSGLNLEQIK